MPTHIVHLSILNPVRHTRMYGKWARTQAAQGHRVEVMGQGRGGVSIEEGVTLRPQGTFGRMGARRWTANGWLLRRAAPLKADVYVLHTPELLLRAGWLKRRTGAQLHYDVHEDYALNLRHGAHWPALLRRPLAWLFRRWERRQVRRHVDRVTYAERIYANVLRVPDGQWAVRENKATRPEGAATLTPPAEPYLLYCGTLARAWGLFEAVALWQRWYAQQPIGLVIAGHTQQPALLRELQAAIQATGLADHCRLIGGEEYVPHADILALIDRCHAGLALYHDLPQIRGKVPTRFFEFMQAKRPLIFSPQPAWLDLNAQTPFGLPFHPGDDITLLQQQVERWVPPDLPASAYRWGS